MPIWLRVVLAFIGCAISFMGGFLLACGALATALARERATHHGIEDGERGDAQPL